MPVLTLGLWWGSNCPNWSLATILEGEPVAISIQEMGKVRLRCACPLPEVTGCQGGDLNPWLVWFTVLFSAVYH